MKTADTDFLIILSEYQDIIHKINLVYFNTAKARKENFQDIAYQLWESFPSLKGEKKIACWVYAIAFNTSLTLIKEKRKRFPERFSENKETSPRQSREFNKLLVAIRELNDTDRAVLLLYLENYTCSQISDILGISCMEMEEKLIKIVARLPENHDLKVIWQKEVSTAFSPHSKNELARIVAKNTKIVVINRYPECLLILAILFFIGYLAWKAKTRLYSPSATVFYVILIGILLGTLLLTGWSARRIRTYPPYFSLKEWLKYYIDWIDQILKFRKRYEALLYVGIILFGIGIAVLYYHLENQSFSISHFVGVIFLLGILLYARTRVMNGHYCKMRRFLENLYREL